MSDLAPEASISARPAVGVIETDSFCAGCGFNLHSQKVWLDERLGIPVCRCPECGKHAVAGMKTTATGLWLRRLALVGSIAWALTAFAFVVGVFFFAIGIHAAADEGLTYRTLQTTSGRTVDYDYTNGSLQYSARSLEADGTPTTVPVTDVLLRRKLSPLLTGESMSQAYSNATYGRPSNVFEVTILGSMLALGWLLCAMLLAAGSWFWRPWRRWLWLAVPTLAGITVLILMLNQDDSGYWGPGVRQVNDVPIALFVGLIWLGNAVLMAIGLIIGRPFVRLLLTIFIPPKPRQLFAFLWHCDGKTMPADRRPITP